MAPEPGEGHEADRERFEERIIAFERGGLALTDPVQLEDELRNLAIIGLGARDFLSAARRSSVNENHVGVPGMHAVERRPDTSMVVAVDAASERDFRPSGRQRFDFGAAFGSDEVTTVDDCGGRLQGACRQAS